MLCRKTSYTHEACGYALNVDNIYGTNKHSYYRGKDCIQKFCKELRDNSKKIVNAGKKEMIPLTNEEEDIYEKSKYCHICNKEFNADEKDKNYAKVRDHDHYTGKFRDAARSICNLRYQEQR